MIFLDGQQVLFSKFPNGETKLNQINAPHVHTLRGEIRVTLVYESDQDLINLMFLKQWLNANCRSTCFKYLEIMYMPYSRADRKILYHEPTLIMILTYLKSLQFDKYSVYDPHSGEEIYKCLDIHVVDQLGCVKGEIAYKGYYDYIIDNFVRDIDITILAPDKGAEKKSLKIANYFGLPFMVANKVRDVVTGNITDTQILGNVEGKNLFIFDDIIDGGATFIELAKVAKDNGANDL
jgi:ribose-phosphate pyrophosphokinase